MNKLWTDLAWEDYLFWQAQDKKRLKRIHALIKDIERGAKNGSPHDGIGKPEPLKHEFQGFWSRRIDDEHRLIYQINGENLEIISCRTHYEPH